METNPVSKKDRIEELESRVRDLERDNESLNDLLVKLAQELADLKRKVWAIQ